MTNESVFSIAKIDQSCQSYRKLFDFLIIHIAERNISARLAQSEEHETVKLAAVSSSALGDTLFPYY